MNTMQNVSDCRNASRISPLSGMAGIDTTKALASRIEVRPVALVGRWRSLGMAAFAAAALATVFVVASRSAQAGPAFEIWATEYGDDSTNVDDMLVQTPVRWPSDRQPVQIVLYQALNGSIIAPNSNPEGIGADGEDTIRQALRRGIEAWNDVDNSSFKFEKNIRYSTYLEGAKDFLPLGPYQSMIDTFNLVTFQDPNYPVLPDGVLAATNVFYIQRDFDLTGANVAIPGAIIQQLTGGVDAIVVDGQLQPNLFLPHRSYKAGEILEADIIMDSEYNAWKAYPEDPDDLSPSIPRDTVRGDIDLQAIFTRELGHVAGLTNTLLRLPVMASTYRSKNVPLDQVNVWERADPWEARELQLDDKLGISQAYPTSGYWSSAGIEGSIRDGRAYDSNADNPLPYVPDIAVFLGRKDQPAGGEDNIVNLDLVLADNVGNIRLQAMTLSGRNMRVPGSTGESSYYDSQQAWEFFLVPEFWTRFGATANGNFEIHGLPAEADNPWYVYVNTDSDQYNWTWSFGNRGLFGQFATAPEEFYGGVDPTRPLPGDGSATDDNSFVDTLFANSFIGSGLTPTLQTGFYLAGSRVGGAGGYLQVVADDESFAEIGVTRTAKEVQYYRNQGRPFGVDAATVEIDQFLNEAEGDGMIATYEGDRLLQTLYKVRLAPFRTDMLPRHFLLDVTLVNKSRAPMAVGYSYVHRASAGIGTANEITVFAKYSDVRQDLVLEEKGFGAGFADPLPEDLLYQDVEDQPTAVAAFHVQGEGVTTPDSVVVGDFYQMQKEVLATFEPRGIDLFTTLNGAPGINDIGILYRYSPIDLDPGTSRTIQLVASFTRNKNSMALLDGPVGTTNPDQVYLDYPFHAEPIELTPGQTVGGVIIYTNTGASSLLFDYLDWDGDGVQNDVDNCPWVPNPGQETSENVRPRGLACVDDYDGDGIDDNDDNCFSPEPLSDYPNFDQANTDLRLDLESDDPDYVGDELGDACDPDIDNDGIENDLDNCPYVPNEIPPGQTAQVDTDRNGVGDACELDYDGDGVPNDFPDNCERIPNPNQEDSDEDEIGDACDTDIDDDGVDNISDNCPTVPNPIVDPATAQADEDEDGIGDACENLGVTVEYQKTRLPLNNIHARGAAFGDLNGDGYVDLVIAVSGIGNDSSSNYNRVYMNQAYRGRPGYFEDETLGMNRVPDQPASDQLGTGDDRLPLSAANTWDVKLVDFDLDGDLDIYFSNFSSFSGATGNAYGAEDQLLFNIDVNDPRKNPSIDNDDLGDGFFVDATDDSLPGILNTKGMVGPNTISYQVLGNATAPININSTRSEMTDVDGDGDPDIIVSAENPFRGNYAGLPDLAGTRFTDPLKYLLWYYPRDTTTPAQNPSTWSSTTVFNQRTLFFSETLLINRRNELRLDDGTPSGKPIPRGTPDAFLVFKEQSETLKRRAGFSPDPDPSDVLIPNFFRVPPDNREELPLLALYDVDSLTDQFIGVYLGRRLDRYFFRDETLGRDGIFGGSARRYPFDLDVPAFDRIIVDPRNIDRLPPTYPDDFPTGTTAPEIFTTDQADYSSTREVVSGDLLLGSGPELIVANRWNPTVDVGGRLSNSQWAMDSFNPVLANQDITDSARTGYVDTSGNAGNAATYTVDGIDDGYFYLCNFGNDDLFSARIRHRDQPTIQTAEAQAADRRARTLAVLNEIDAFGNSYRYTGLSVIGGDDPTVHARTSVNSQGILIGDLDYTGQNDFIDYTDAYSNSIYNSYTIDLTAGEYSVTGLNFLRYQKGGIGGAGRDVFGDLDIWFFTEFRAESYLPAGNGRTQHATLCDLDNDGAVDILKAQDGPDGLDSFHITTPSGPQQFISGDGFDASDSWVDRSGSTLVPSRAVMSGTFVTVADVDNDGDQDVLFLNHGGQSRLYLNNLYEHKPRTDQYVSAAPGTPPLPSNYVNSVDLALANELPLFYDGTNLTMPPYASQSAGTNTDEKFLSNATYGLTIGDIDRDGDPDLLFINGGDDTEMGDLNQLLLNRGLSARPYANRVFTTANRSFPAPRLTNSGVFNSGFLDSVSRPGYDAAFFDYDQDGDLDFLVTNYQDRLRLFENRDADDPRFLDNFPNVKIYADSVYFYNSLNDYDTDPRDATSFDQYNAALGFSRLARATVELGDGCFEDVTDDVDMPAGGKIEQTGTPAAQFSQRPGIGDVDGDTFIDVVVPQNLNGVGSPNRLFLNKLPPGLEGDARARRFSDFSYQLPQAPIVNLDGSPTGAIAGLYDGTMQAVLADFDADGDVDIFFVNQKASEPSFEDPTSSAYRPNFVWWSRLVMNQGGRQNGALGQFVDASDFVEGHVRDLTDAFYHRSYTSAKVYDLNLDGDFCEDADGNGIVTDEEILAFENLIEAKNNLEGGDFFGNEIADSFQDSRIRYQDETTVYTGGVQGGLKPPVDQLIPLSRLSRIARPEVPHSDDLNANRDHSTLWRRKPRWIDRNGNGQCDPSYDMVLTSSDGLGLTILLNNNNGTFRDATDELLDFEQKQKTYGVDVADVDLDGYPDILACFASPDINVPTVLLFWADTDINGSLTGYQDYSETALPQTYVIRDRADNAANMNGASRQIKVTDVDGDGDFDCVIANNGRRIGSAWYGGTNQVFLNRIRGGSWNTKTGLFISRGVGSGGPIIESRLKVSSVFPRLAMRGTESLAMTVYGVNFKNGAAVYMGDGVTLMKPPVVRTDQILEVIVEIDANAAPGPRSVVVKNPDGESAQSRSDAFIVASPELVVHQPTDPAAAGSQWYHYE